MGRIIGMARHPEIGRRLFCGTALVTALAPARATEVPAPPRGDEPARPPRVEVRNVRRVFHDGAHDAFTDLVRYGGRIWLCFRSCPDGHMVHPTASIVILSSADGGAWREEHRFSVPDRDTRDPHFLVFKGRLLVITGTWYTGPTSPKRSDFDVNLHLGFACWTDDGATWHGPTLLEGTFGHYVWRAAASGEKAYLCGRRKLGFEVLARGEPRTMESLMLESDDGLVWRKRAVFQEIAGDETAFLFDAQGAVTAIGRHGERKEAQLLRSAPPYDRWERKSLALPLGGPLITRFGAWTLVGGRKTAAEQGAKTTLFWLVGNELEECAELPSGGDTSYPGFVEFSPVHGLVSWYSSHETGPDGKPITAIYLADLVARQ
jgi:hypothetical protein